MTVPLRNLEQLEFDNRFVHSFVQQQDFEELGALPSDTENVINLTMAVEGTEVAVLFMEQPHGGVKVSFRSRGGLDCNRAAAEFGGGGHKAAAGASMDQSLAEARPLVLHRLRELIAQLAT